MFGKADALALAFFYADNLRTHQQCEYSIRR